jgi:methylamine dehydrogenase accessory protein MauD
VNRLLIVSHLGLWILTGFLLVTVWALARQIGLLHRRLAPAGARMEAIGPVIGELAPAIDATDLAGRRVTLGAARGRQTLVVFLSPGCSACGDLMPAVRSLRRSERKRLDLVLVSVNEEESANRRYVSAHRLEGISYVSSKEIGRQFQIAGPPYAVLVGPDGRVQAKGLANHLEHLESLLTAARLGHPSFESYMAARPAPHPANEPDRLAETTA